MRTSEDMENITNLRRETLNGASLAFALAMHRGRPFYPHKLFAQLQKFQECINDEARICNESYLGNVSDEHVKKANNPKRLTEVRKDIDLQVQNICDAIETRLGATLFGK